MMKKGISYLNRNKSYGFRGSSSNHFIYAPDQIAEKKWKSINSMLIHGYSSDDLFDSILISIPKNYRLVYSKQ